MNLFCTTLGPEIMGSRPPSLRKKRHPFSGNSPTQNSTWAVPAEAGGRQVAKAGHRQRQLTHNRKYRRGLSREEFQERGRRQNTGGKMLAAA